jgi:hypothetical protein
MKSLSVIFQAGVERDIQNMMERTGKSYEECKFIVETSL